MNSFKRGKKDQSCSSVIACSDWSFYKDIIF